MLKNYNKVSPVKVPLEQFKERLSAIARADKRVLVLKIVDIFDFEGSVVTDFDEIIGKDNPVLLVSKQSGPSSRQSID